MSNQTPSVKFDGATAFYAQPVFLLGKYSRTILTESSWGKQCIDGLSSDGTLAQTSLP